MARWDRLPEITKHDLKRLYHVRNERDYAGYQSFNEFCLAEYERTERSINRILFKAGRRSPLTKKRVKLKEKRQTERTILDKFGAKYKAMRSSPPPPISTKHSDVPREDRSDVPQLLSDVPRPSRNTLEASKHRDNQNSKDVNGNELRNTKAHEGHDYRSTLRASTESNPFQRKTSTEVSGDETEGTYSDHGASASNSRSQSSHRSPSAYAPNGAHPEYDHGASDDDPYWPLTKEEWQAQYQELGTFRGRFP